MRVGSAVAVDPDIFISEVNTYDLSTSAGVDIRCLIITEEYRRKEQEDPHLVGTAGRVCSGTGVSRSEFILRRAPQARDVPELADYLTDLPREINTACTQGEDFIVECSQGTHLSLALSEDYPCYTSDNCPSVAAADDVGLNWRHIRDVVLEVKTLPSRVGHCPSSFDPKKRMSLGLPNME
ncbi:MAG TPA: hypothetical protein DIU35_19775 [Candidatus Latescibacteria bacterium]|nr:hypothetical protein [Gemmatimonadota bacterium]HCR19721.1 hypothetical protein [Candidatus Latescibacterota bacterium]